MNKNETIISVVVAILLSIAGIAAIYADYKTTQRAIENGLEECQIDTGTRTTMWVRDCSDHIKVTTEMENKY